MKYASEIVGLPVVDFSTGQKFEKVIDVLFDDERNQVLALLTDPQGIFSEANVILWGSIQSIGDDAIIVPSKDVEVKASTHEQVSEAAKEDKSVRGKTVMTENGKDLGKVSDLQIDTLTGRVIGYKTSGGIFADAYQGQAIVPAPETLKVGENVVFVPDSTVQTMEQQIGGIKAAAMAAAEKAAELKDKVVETTQTVADTTKEKAGELRDKAVDTYEKTKEKAQSPETQAKVDELKAKAKDALGTAKDKTTEAWDKTKDTVQEMAGTAKEKTVDLKDQTTEKIEETRVNNSIGCPVDRVILDRSDEVTLNRGDIVTNEAVAKAREAGMLDALLGAVTSPDVGSADGMAHRPEPEDGTAAAQV